MFPPAGQPRPGPGELFGGAGGRGDPLRNAGSTGTTPPPSSVFGNLKPHSGGPGQPGYPFFGSNLGDVPGVNVGAGQRAALARPRPDLATEPAGEPAEGIRDLRPADFHGAPTRHFNPDEPLQPPVHNQFDTLRDEAGQTSVNNSLRHATGPLQVGSSGIGASTGQLPIRTTDGFHTSVDPRGDHATFEVDPALNPDGTTHLYPGGASSSVAPRQPGEVGNRPLNDFPNQRGDPLPPGGPAPRPLPAGPGVGEPLPPATGHPHPFPLRPVQETNPSGTGSFYPDPDMAAAVAGGPGGAGPPGAGPGGAGPGDGGPGDAGPGGAGPGGAAI
jgi:hypothetical protein